MLYVRFLHVYVCIKIKRRKDYFPLAKREFVSKRVSVLGANMAAINNGQETKKER